MAAAVVELQGLIETTADRVSLSQVDGDGRRAVRSVQETWAPFHTVDRVADHRLSIIDASALTID